MAHTDLERFLRSLSTHSHLRRAFAEDPEKVMSEAGLSAEEQKLVRSRDVAAIKKYLGDSYLAAIKIQLTD